MTAPSLVPLVRQVLSSPTAEPAMRRQVLQLARQNLHQPGMVEALLAVLPAVREDDLRRAVLALVADLDTTRIADLAGLYGCLLAALEHEEDRGFRAVLIARLAEGIAQDPRIAPALAGLLAKPQIDDTEAAALVAAVGQQPRLDASTVLIALAAVQGRAAHMQQWAIELACSRCELDDAVVAALAGLLTPRTPAGLRLDLLRRLHRARRAPVGARANLAAILASDPDAAARCEALKLLALLPRDAELTAQIAAAASHDSDPTVRRTAAGLLQAGGTGDAAGDALANAERLVVEADPTVRIALLDALRPHLRDQAVLHAVLRTFVAAAIPPDDAEADLYLDLLTPYASRVPAVREQLLAACRAAPRLNMRARILAALVPRVRLADIADLLADLFASERDAELRATVFAQLKPLPVARHPRLIAAWCGELLEPSSPFRLACAGALCTAVEESPEIQRAFADVLSCDTDRVLVRTCLDGYLKPGVTRLPGPLLAVIGAQELETVSRQRALDAVVKLPLAESDQQQLADLLVGPGAAALKRS